MTKIWAWLKSNLGAVLNAGIVAMGIVVAWLDMAGRSSPEAVREATLALLSLIGASLLMNHTTNSRLQQATKDILQMNQTTHSRLKETTEEILEHLQKPSALSEVITPYSERMQEISEHLMQADEVWILSRTCRMIWRDYQDELQVAARRDGLRLLFINPNDGVLDMIVKSAIWWQPDDGKRLKMDVKHFVKHLKLAQVRLKLDKLEVRLIDYLPAWTLILINPRKNDGVIYVEFATYRSHSRKHPGFVVQCSLDNNLFNQFCDEFEQMWDDAQSAWEHRQDLHQE